MYTEGINKAILLTEFLFHKYVVWGGSVLLQFPLSWVFSLIS